MEVTLHTPDTIYSPRHVPSWMLLAAGAGMVNGTGFVICEQFVTHVTGTVTRLGLEWHAIGILAEYTTVLLCFILGGAVSVVALQARAARGKRPQWATPLVFVAFLLLGVAVLGDRGAFGHFSEIRTGDEPPVVLLSVLAFAMGLQNAAVASTTGLAVRTTHLSGPATDLGIHLGTAVLTGGDVRYAALRGAALRGGKIFAFALGAAVSLPLTQAYGFLSLIAPAIFVLIAAGVSFATNRCPQGFEPDGPDGLKPKPK